MLGELQGDQMWNPCQQVKEGPGTVFLPTWLWLGVSSWKHRGWISRTLGISILEDHRETKVAGTANVT